MFNCAFIYVAPKCTPDVQTAIIPGEEIQMIVKGVSDYAMAEKVAVELVKDYQVTAVELCAGFGMEGVARIKKAVGPDVSVGAVRFDYHPAFGFKSGDDVF